MKDIFKFCPYCGKPLIETNSTCITTHICKENGHLVYYSESKSNPTSTKKQNPSIPKDWSVVMVHAHKKTL